MNNNFILSIFGVLADVITVLSIWGLGNNSPVWVRIMITVASVIAVVLIYVVYNNNNDKGKVVDFALDEQKNVTDIFLKKNNIFKMDTLLSIYIKCGTKSKLVGIGLVIDNPDGDYVQSNILTSMDRKLLNSICQNTTNIKNFYAKPNVRYADIDGTEILNF